MALKFMQFDSENPADSVDLKELADTDIKENEKPAVPKDTSKTEVAIIENKDIPRQQPIDATKRGTTRNKKVRQ